MRRPRGRGRRALPTSRSAEATSAPHLYVTGSASARSRHGPGLRRAAASGCRAVLRPRDPPRRARPPLRAGFLGKMPHVAVASLFDRLRPRGAGRGNCKRGTRPPPPLPGVKDPGHSPDHPGAGGKGRTERRVYETLFPPGPLTVSEPLRLPVRTVSAFSCSVTISQNPITSQSKPPAIGQRGG